MKQVHFGKIPQAMPLPDLLDMQTRRGINQLQSRILRQSVGDAPIRLAVPKASPIRVETVRLP